MKPVFLNQNEPSESLPTLKISRFCLGKNILIVSAGFLIASADRLIVSAEAIRKEERKSPLHLPHKGGVLGCHLFFMIIPLLNCYPALSTPPYGGGGGGSSKHKKIPDGFWEAVGGGLWCA